MTRNKKDHIITYTNDKILIPKQQYLSYKNIIRYAYHQHNYKIIKDRNKNSCEFVDTKDKIVIKFNNGEQISSKTHTLQSLIDLYLLKKRKEKIDKICSKLVIK